MKSMRKRNRIILLILLILGLGLGYAFVYGDLKFEGIALVKKQTWDVHFDNIQVTEGSKTPVSGAAVDGSDTTQLGFNVYLENPGDFYEFTFDVVNNGTIDAMITGISNKKDNQEISAENNFPSYIKYSVTYDDEVPVEVNHLIEKRENENTPTTLKIKVRIEFRSDINPSDLVGATEINANLKFGLTYSQANNNAIPKPSYLDSYTWAVLISEYNNGNPSDFLRHAMSIGAKKTVKLDMNHDGEAEKVAHVRLANITKPTECGNSGFSQSACGLVFEFVEVLDYHSMNSLQSNTTLNGNGNTGGWEYSELRAYMNGNMYAAGNNNFSGVGIIDALPSDLYDRLINTTVVSGHGSRDSANYTTTDKLYALSTHEIWVDNDGDPNSGMDYNDTAYGETRQLDYYAEKQVKNNENYSYASKKSINGYESNWWTRSANSVNDSYFYRVNTSGNASPSNSSPANAGVCPAFRIAN